MKKIGYLGPEGTFTHAALQTWAPTNNAIGWESAIPLLFKKLSTTHYNSIFIPIENSIEGPVTTTLDLLIQHKNCYINEEYVMPITQTLLTKNKIDYHDITEIWSHPQPIAQCQSFITTHLSHCHIHITSSTATAAEKLSQSTQTNVAVIGHSTLSAIYNLTPLQHEINDNKDNETRFVHISNTPSTPSKEDKTSIVFSTQKDQPGSLYTMLSIFARHHINLTKIESRPNKKKLGEYLFLVDCLGHSETAPLKDVLTHLENHALYFKCLGSYPIGKLTK